MNSGPELPRRAFLGWLGSAAALGAAPAWVASLAGCGPGAELSAALAGFYRDEEAARAVGREYLDRFPDERDPDALVERLAGDGERQRRWERLARRDPEGLVGALRDRHRDDFAAERVVLLRGWMLSETELRLCALAALS